MSPSSPSLLVLLLLLLAGLSLRSQSPETFGGPPTHDPLMAARLHGPTFLERHQCHRCHELPTGVLSSDHGSLATPLRDLTGRLSPSGLLRRLEASHARSSEGAPPNLFSSVPVPERDRALQDLLAFLLSGQSEVLVETTIVPLREVEEGSRLYHALGCVACHGPHPSMPEENSELEPDHSARTMHHPGLLPLRVQPGDMPLESLAAFLQSGPSKDAPRAAPHFPLEVAEARAIAAFLLHDHGDDSSSSVSPGVVYRLWTGRLAEAFPSTKGLKFVRQGTASTVALPRAPDNHFFVEYEADLLVTEEGEYTIFLGSDDGSRLWLNGELLITNDGIHPYVEKQTRISLTEGYHALRVAYFEAEGEASLDLRWAFEGGPKIPINSDRFFQRTRRLAGSRSLGELAPVRSEEEGAKWANLLHCDRCHSSEAPIPMEPRATTFEELQLGKGCLSPGTQSPTPRYALNAFDHLIVAGLMADPKAALGPQSEAIDLKRRLMEQRCFSCHERDGFGGVPSALRDHFTLAVGQDLGDQDATPPSLTGVGRKLKTPWIERVLRGEARAHHHLKVRMPVYNEEVTRPLLAGLLSADLPAPSDASSVLATPANFQDGTELLGIRGLGCIRCHSLMGMPSLGLAGVDLAEVTDRIRYSWFREFLLDPNSVLPTTRMPNFFENGKSTAVHIAAGNPKSQIDALWSTLLLKEAMPLPEGLITDHLQYELIPRNGPLEVAVFMKAVSPRTLLVGNPEGVHYAFDLERGLLARAWKGRFFNAKGTWDQRAGELEEIPPAHSISWTLARNLAWLGDKNDAWPRIGNGAVSVRGRTYDASRLPTFHLAHEGVEFDDHFQPKQFGNEWGLRWTRTVSSSASVAGSRKLFWRVASGQIQAQSDEQITLSGLRVLHGDAAPMHVIERRSGQVDILIEVPLAETTTVLKADLLW